MAIVNQRLDELLQGYSSGRLTHSEHLELFSLMKDLDQAAQIKRFLDDRLQAQSQLETAEIKEVDWNQMFQDIVQPAAFSKKPASTIVGLRSSWLRYAAAAILVLAAGFYFWPKPGNQRSVVKQTRPRSVIHDVAPGGNKAALTLSDGSVIMLDSAADGQLAQQGNMRVIKLADGQVEYKSLSQGLADDRPAAFNTMRTPRGGQYQLTLPDGSRVWLNAASSITYPVVFTGKERKVEITGEAYFEVVKNSRLPFRVHMDNGTEVEVLGTHFNVNAYADEPAISATLLEGSVKVISTGAAQMLSPGQQAQLSEPGKIKLIRNANTQQAVSWKDGAFNFHHVKLEAVMRQLSRWYDVEVVYPNGIPDMEFWGEIQKTLPLREMLEALGAVEVRFKIEDRKLIVLH